MNFGEIVKIAALDTLMGMVVVFSVLILISFLISLLKYVPMMQEKMAKKKEAKKTAKNPAPEAGKESPVSVPVSAPAAPSQDPVSMNDLSLIAVITAAIAAATDTPADGIVIRSIRRSEKQSWKRG